MPPWTASDFHELFALPAPSKRLESLAWTGKLSELFPELAALRGVEQDPRWHPEGDAFAHTLHALDRAMSQSADPAVRFAALVHDLGKGTTLKADWPQHIGHEIRGVPLVTAVCDRIGAPADWRAVAALVTEHHLRVHRVLDMKPGSVLALLQSLGGLDPKPSETLHTFYQVITVCEADNYGKFRETYPAGDFLRAASETLSRLSWTRESGETPEQYRQRQLRAITFCRQTYVKKESPDLPTNLTAVSPQLSGFDVTKMTGLTGADLQRFMRDFMAKNKAALVGLSTTEARLRVLVEWAFTGIPSDLDLYVVGGAVRDTILGLPVKDIDFVVVGQTPASMTARGYDQVGQDFPVYLDSHGRQFALARTERSTGAKYTDFTVETSGVRLEEDLVRRDLTINAIALSRSGTLVDPCGGVRDLGGLTPASDRKVWLRPTSIHFWEDPLRVLRVARLTGKLGSAGITAEIDPDLVTDAQRRVQGGILNALPKERVFGELAGILTQQRPSEGLLALRELGVLDTAIPLGLAPTNCALAFRDANMTAKATQDPAYVFAAICARSTPKNRERIYQKLGVPSAWSSTAERVAKGRVLISAQNSGRFLSPQDTVAFLDTLQAYQFPDAFDKGLKTLFTENDDIAHYHACADAARAITGTMILEETSHDGRVPGPWVREELAQRRATQIDRVLREATVRTSPSQNMDQNFSR